MGKTIVAIFVGPKLVVDGKTTDLGDGRSLSTADGVDVSRRGNVYFVTSPSGNSVRATVNVTDKTSWIDVLVGLDQCCANATAKGLLSNANGNVNQLAARDGTVLNNPYSLKDLNQYGDSWRVSPKESLFDYEFRSAYLGRCGSFHLIGTRGERYAVYLLSNEKYFAELFAGSEMTPTTIFISHRKAIG